ncbi:MAG: O-antigen ligase family protein [Verrucomicrobiae bacterium]|nr:O-antigen ligase family protein [Verrucomicrobiae bacterium]NNJ42531.1 O-antigen ligase family protein [Akkermansiaceae bacterium]
MRSIIIIFTCAALLVAGLIGITLSVPLQAPAVILLGLAAIFAAAQVVKCGSAGVRECGKKDKGKEERQQTTDDRRGKDGQQRVKEYRSQTTDDRQQKKEECGSLELQNSQTTANRGIGWLLSLVAIFYFVGRACLSPVWDLGVEDLMLILSAGLLYLIAGYTVGGKSGIRLRLGLAAVVVVLLLLHLGACVLQIKGSEGYSLSLYLGGSSRASVDHVTGMYGYYGSFGNFAVIAGLLCLSLGVWGRFSYGIRTIIFLLGLTGLGLALWSQSRSAALSLVFGLGSFAVMILVSLSGQTEALKLRLKMVIGALGLLGLIAGCVGGVWVFNQRGVEGLSGVFDSGVRVSYWAMAAEQWADHPWFGAGSRSFSYECFRYWSPNLDTGQRNPEFVHNEYLQLLADYGLMGLVLIVGLLGWHFYWGGKQVHRLAEKVGEGGLKQGSNAIALGIAGVCGMTAMAVHICFDFRTHLLANLLLLVCCAVWILPVPRNRKQDGRKTTEDRRQRIRSWVLGGVLLFLGLGAVGLGGHQLWAGWPLVEHKMAKEHGAWAPESADREVCIPALEESLARAPQWRRYQRLGVLYRLEADSVGEKAREEALMKAEGAYWASMKRHPHNPISRINLAAIYTAQKKWQLADEMYASAAELAIARERWFRMHRQWGDMHILWARDLTDKRALSEVEPHYLRAKDLYNFSFNIAQDYSMRRWVARYTKILVDYARFLDSQKKFAAAEVEFQEAQKLTNWFNWQVDTNLNFYYADHLYERGMSVWLQRKPEEAYQLMKRAKKALLSHPDVSSEKIQKDETWKTQMKKIQEVIDFLEATGIKK